MKVTVDSTRCQGHARCMMSVPDVFSSDDDGYAVAIADTIPPDLQDAVTEAQDNCPEQAIVISEW